MPSTEKEKGEEKMHSLSYWTELIKHYSFCLLIIHAEIRKVTGYSTEPIILSSFITKN